jgi:CheY-like chemotaxis protein
LEVSILNLAVNARDAMPDGGKLTIETANCYLDEQYVAAQAEVPPGQYVMVAVTDTGSGMTPEVKTKAFDPFFTTKDVGHGTGLGLSQVYGFVKQSGGHVKIYSEVNEGTTIKIYLPRFHSDDASIEQERAMALPRGTETETILVVEDDHDVRNYACETLRELGYKVLDAENGSAALQLLERHADVHLLLTDVGLPGGMNGRRLAEEAQKRRTNLKVLFTTGYARNAIVHGGRLDPGVQLMPKPFTQETLATKVRDILDTRSAPARILVVEDEALIQMLVTGYLESAGFRVDTVGSATEALNKLRMIPGAVDAVIVDVGLPDRSGDTLVREIRALHPSLPIIVASGRQQSTLRRLFQDEPRIAFVAKPYTDEDLRIALRAIGLLR